MCDFLGVTPPPMDRRSMQGPRFSSRCSEGLSPWHRVMLVRRARATSRPKPWELSQDVSVDTAAGPMAKAYAGTRDR